MLLLLIALQAVQVAFLWLHDWAPLPPLNDVKAAREADSTSRLALVTLIQSGPYSIGLISLIELKGGFHTWLWYWLWISYSALFLGELRAWWVPYLLKAEPDRAARYRTLFGATHSFLPERNGMKPNTLHIILHAFTAATLVVLALVT
jgi:hypothetical protein